MPPRPWSEAQKRALSKKMRAGVTEKHRQRSREVWAERFPEKAAIRQTILNSVMPENCDTCGRTDAVLFVTDYKSTPPKFLWRCSECARDWREHR